MTPLDGIKVIELARILAGPWAGQTLADLGAEVIKVEAPEGDDTRRWGPPFIERELTVPGAFLSTSVAATGGVAHARGGPCDRRAPRGTVAHPSMITAVEHPRSARPFLCSFS